VTLCSAALARVPAPGALCARRTVRVGVTSPASASSASFAAPRLVRASLRINRPSRPPLANTSRCVGAVATAFTLAPCPIIFASIRPVSASNIATARSALAVSTRASSRVHATSYTAFSCAAIAVARRRPSSRCRHARARDRRAPALVADRERRAAVVAIKVEPHDVRRLDDARDVARARRVATTARRRVARERIARRARASHARDAECRFE
jgi:hypothetical protein